MIKSNMFCVLFYQLSEACLVFLAEIFQLETVELFAVCVRDKTGPL